MLKSIQLKHTVRLMLGLFLVAGLTACPDNDMDNDDRNDNVMENRQDNDGDDD